MTMIKKLAMVGSVAAFALATPAFAAGYTAPSADANATVRLYNAITISKDTDLDFGTVIRDSAFPVGGVQHVTMSTASALGCASANLTCTGASQAAHFLLKGDNSSAMTVSMSGVYFDAVTGQPKIDLLNGTNAVTVDLTVAGMTAISATPGSYSATGTGADQDLYVGGDLSVPDNTVAPNGKYQSTFTLTADYN